MLKKSTHARCAQTGGGLAPPCSLCSGLQVTDDQLQEAAVQSGILTVDDDFLTPEFRTECQKIMDTDLLKPADCKEAFLCLKRNFSLQELLCLSMYVSVDM